MGNKGSSEQAMGTVEVNKHHIFGSKKILCKCDYYGLFPLTYEAVATVSIPAGAIIVYPNQPKWRAPQFRCDKYRIDYLEIDTNDKISNCKCYSYHFPNHEYEINKLCQSDIDMDVNNMVSQGFHFFKDREAAEIYPNDKKKI